MADRETNAWQRNVELRRWRSLSMFNRQELGHYTMASCFHCCSVMTISSITDWCDDGQTAICPTCGVDAVLPGNCADELLNEMHAIWFVGGE